MQMTSRTTRSTVTGSTATAATPSRPTAVRSTATVAGAAVLLGLLGATAPAASAATSAACRTALSASLPTADPTTLQDAPSVAVRVRGGRATSVRITLTRGSARVATGSATSTPAGTTAIPLRLLRTPSVGALRVRVTGRVAGCGRVSRTTSVRLRKASLPVRAALRATTVVDGRSVVRVLLRTVGTGTATGVRVALVNAAGTRVASTGVAGRLRGPAEVALRSAGTLPSGRYRVVVTGRSGSAKASSTSSQSITLSKVSSDASAATAEPARQRAVVDWSGPSSAGRDVAGFLLPGIGHGEVVCSANTQWMRVFPSDLGRETSMLTWTYRSWDGNSQNAEKALREALATTGTGRDFNEGFNKFQPAEKQSTGEFTALLSDRGPLGAPFAPSLAAPIGIHVTWAWDFRDPNAARCHVEAEVVAQTPGAANVGSAQVQWRGDAAAAGRDSTSVDLPGVGRIQLTCRATPSGARTARLDLPGAATVTTREGSVDTAVPQAAGPVVAELPNNGQIQIDTAAGARVLIASRWKVNDPDPSRNSCAIAAQSVAK